MTVYQIIRPDKRIQTIHGQNPRDVTLPPTIRPLVKVLIPHDVANDSVPLQQL